jgi:hypothetical protein
MWNKATDAEESFRNKAIWGSAIAVVVVIIGIGAYYRYYAPSGAPEKVRETRPPPPSPAVTDEGGIQHPIPNAGAEASALPALNQSDQMVRDSLAGLLGSRSVEQFVVSENVIRHIVVTVDNLPRKKVAIDLRPVKPTPGETVVSNQGDVATLSVSNYARYAPFVHLVETTDPKTLAAVYFHLYPLFQQAYEDLGYPGRFFNDRLVEVIDHLLAAPEPQGPIELVQPKVFYQYSDLKLEDLSSGQKLMIRMGPANERTLKAKLRDLRAELVRSAAGDGGTRQGSTPGGGAQSPAAAAPPKR